MLRKVFALMLAVCMIALCSCHVKNDESSERESSSQTEDSSQTEQVEIVFREGENEDGPVVLTNDNIVSAEAQAIKYPADDVLDYVVVLTLNDEGSEAFAKATQRLCEERGTISVWVDAECVSAPTVLEAITDGKVVITGNFTYDEAKALAGKING
ncbi:MAG: hypothetical protein IJH80_07785 [Ruminococcus sp.]|nr:hypothetical protein [Ruminococcus sp.]